VLGGRYAAFRLRQKRTAYTDNAPSFWHGIVEGKKMVTRTDIEYIINDVRRCDLDSYEDDEIAEIVDTLCLHFDAKNTEQLLQHD
jgi:hypothetical protein